MALDVGSGLPGLKVHTFIGGMSVADDVAKLKKCHIACGTPGRIKQLINEGRLKTDSIHLLVLDEADKLMEFSFLGDITDIVHSLPSTKQVISTSATYPEELSKILEKFMRQPTHLTVSKENQVLTGVTQYVIVMNRFPNSTILVHTKADALFHVLNTVPFSQCLVFSNYAVRAESLCVLAEERGWPAIFISSIQDQRNRLHAMSRLKQFQIRVMFTTDLTARGIDARNVDLVVNFDVPWDAATYLHRIGRSGRFGSRSIAITMASNGEELDRLRRIVYETGSQVHILPKTGGVIHDVDLWQGNLSELVKIEGLESSAVDEPNNDVDKPSWSRRGNNKKRGKKPKVQELAYDADDNYVDITKAWVEVKKDEDDLAQEGAPRPEAVNSSIDDAARAVLHRHFTKVRELGDQLFEDSDPLSLQDIESGIRDFEDNRENYEGQDDEDHKVFTRADLAVNTDVLEAAKAILAHHEKEFSMKVKGVEDKMKNMSTEEAVDYAAKEWSDSSEEKPPTGGLRSLETTVQHREIPFDSYTQLQEDFLETHLPHPNPHRLIPSNPDCQDRSWLTIWHKEVQENAQFIRDMELVRLLRDAL